MNRDQFHNSLRILHSIDGSDFIPEMVALEPGCSGNLPGALDKFLRDPVMFFIRCDDPTCDALWRIIEARQARRAVTDPAFTPAPSAQDALVVSIPEAGFGHARAEVAISNLAKVGWRIVPILESHDAPDADRPPRSDFDARAFSAAYAESDGDHRSHVERYGK